MTEAAYLHSNDQSAYAGEVYHGTPLLLALFTPLLQTSSVWCIRAVFIGADLLVAAALKCVLPASPLLSVCLSPLIRYFGAERSPVMCCRILHRTFSCTSLFAFGLASDLPALCSSLAKAKVSLSSYPFLTALPDIAQARCDFSFHPLHAACLIG